MTNRKGIILAGGSGKNIIKTVMPMGGVALA
jgi:hypothetical protein